MYLSLFLLFCFIQLLSNGILAMSVQRSVPNKKLKEFKVQASGYLPNKQNEYVAVSKPVIPGYITKFQPFTSTDQVQHMLLYGCEQPAFNGSFWHGGATCFNDPYILYAWSRNSLFDNSFTLPEDVAFSIGHKDDSIKYLVLQIHYELNMAEKDFSGITLQLSEIKPRYIAETFLFVGNTPIQPNVQAFISNISCTYSDEPVLYPFAFRVHTHAIGRVASMFVNHEDHWAMIGKQNPQLLQIFQKIDKNITIRKNDILTAICRFDSSERIEITNIGSNNEGEMCNFYMMYYRETNSNQQVNQRICKWNEHPMIMENYPSEGISLLLPNDINTKDNYMSVQLILAIFILLVLMLSIEYWIYKKCTNTNMSLHKITDKKGFKLLKATEMSDDDEDLIKVSSNIH